MTNINNLYPHLQLYYEYMSNGDLTNASNLLSHNDELNKYIQDKNDEHGYMTSNDVSNYINNEISNGKLLSNDNIYSIIKMLQPTFWVTNLNMNTIYIDGLPLSYLEPYFDPDGIIHDIKEEYIKNGDFILTQDNSLLSITNISNVFGLKIVNYNVISSSFLCSNGGIVYQIKVSNEGELYTINNNPQ